MVLFSAALILLGWLTAFTGLKLFKVLLPMVGFVTGLMVGFGGVREVFGHGVVSLTIAIVMALIVGAIMAILSFMFFDIAVVILAVTLGASLFSYLGISLGLNQSGFVLFLFALTGGILGFIVAAAGSLSVSLVISITSLLGIGYILAGIFLLTGTFSVEELNKVGVIRSVIDTVDQSILWLFVWIGAAVAASSFQVSTASRAFFDDAYEYKA